MESNYIEIFKPYGKTPKEMVDFYIEKYKAKKGCFSGRLDPMACGIMRIYLDDFCKLAPNDNYLNKIYRFKFVCGISTTSCDLLGIPNFNEEEFNKQKIIIENDIMDFLKLLQMNYVQTLPIHSSFILKNEKGEKQPLWWWAKENRLNEIQIPSFDKKLYKFEFVQKEKICLNLLSFLAKERISFIDKKHNFNFDPILEGWKNLEMFDKIILQEYEFIITVSSGFYVRKLVEDIGLHFKIPTLTTDIERVSYIF